MKQKSALALLFAMRHVLGALIGVAVAWVPAVQALDAYTPIARHGECGFLCINLAVAGFWGVMAIGSAAAMWFVAVQTIRGLCKEAEQTLD